MDVVFGYGQVGRALVRELVERGRTVRVITRSGPGLATPGEPIAGVEHVRGDASDPAFCRAVCGGAEVIYLCAGAPYHRWAEELAPLQAAVLEGARAAGARLVVLENLYAYGPHDGPLREDLPHAATDAKGRVRARMSEALLDAHRRGEARVVIGRAADFFGPEVRQSLLGERSMLAMLGGKRAEVMGDPDLPHSFSYVPDVARALATLGERPEAEGRVWHLPVHVISQRAALEAAARIAGVEARLSVLSPRVLAMLATFVPVVRELLEIRYQFERPFVVDASAIERAFGLRATPLDEALHATVAWFRRLPPAPRRFALGRALGIFVLDNALIGLAAAAVAALLHAVPALSFLGLGIAVAAGLYWLPPLRRAILAAFEPAPRRVPAPSEHRELDGPTTRIRMLETAAETRGARLRFEQTVQPAAGAHGALRPPRHVHARQSETFTVRSGRLALEADGTVRELGPGESLTVPPGMAHTFWNPGDAPCVHEVTLEPAEHMERFFEGIVTLEALHRLPPHGKPDLLRIALLFGEHDNRVADVPRWIQRIVYAIARGLAWVGGVRAPVWSEVAAARGSGPDPVRAS